MAEREFSDEELDQMRRDAQLVRALTAEVKPIMEQLVRRAAIFAGVIGFLAGRFLP